MTDRRLTTQRVLDQETALQRWAAGACGPSSRTAPHDEAVRDMAGHAGLVLVVGPAGTGKTTATAAAVAHLQAQRRPVVALAPSGKAADVLATEAGCPATTIASFLLAHQHRPDSPLPAGTTVVVDEAGMATTDDLHRIASLAQHHRWRVVCVGDPEQLPAVGRGGTFAHWANTIPHHHLDQPRRFTEPWEAAASLALRAGDPDAAQAYAAHGRLATVHSALLPDRVARLYLAHAQAGQTVAITTTAADTARRINLAIQRTLTPHLRHTVRLADGTEAGIGDTIATRHSDPTLVTDQGHRVRNRHTWTVLGTDRHGTITADHPTRGTVHLPADYAARHVELGWAVTGYGNQGDTTDAAIAALEPNTTRTHTYVALTRGRQSNVALIVDDTGTLDPADALLAAIDRRPATESALATREQLNGPTRSDPGLPTAPPDRSAAILRRLAQLGQGRDGPTVPQR